MPDDTNGVYDVFLKDMSNGMIERVSVDSAGSEANSDSSNSIISPNGQYVVFDSPASNLVPDDTNGVYDVFVRDVVNNTTTRVSL
ncbi:hypothetical protein KA478_00940 [Patescibacteria group bacterium]|nr:hypothetical protein [Patescibacteria group bacterium]